MSRIQGRMGHSKQKDRLGKGMELRERCSSKKPAVNERGAWQDQPMKQLGVPLSLELKSVTSGCPHSS